MRFGIALSRLECPSLVVPQAFGPSVPSLFFTPSTSTRNHRRDQAVCRIVLSNLFLYESLHKSQTFNKTVSRHQTVKRSCSSSSLEGVFFEESLEKYDLSDGEENVGDRGNRLPFVEPEPVMLGIRPEAPEWPERKAVMWATIEQKAKNFDLPLSLRMVKKKLRLEQGFTSSGYSACCSVKRAFASMVFIVVELQSYALQTREVLCREDLDTIIAKVQKEMYSTFVWLFQQVFSRTPALMIYVMILLANFSVYSASRNVSIAETSLCESDQVILLTSVSNSGVSGRDCTLAGKSSRYPAVVPEEHLQVRDQNLRSVEERNLWNSMVGETTKIQAGLRNLIIDHDTMKQFVSPVTVELEPDDYEEYLRTDLLYQVALSQEPNNPLLLCNYAQFLHLVIHDYDRAEQCFKQAVQIEPPDADSLSHYANFLWTVRQDIWAAEERYLQALSIEPDNSYYASKYANFLWNTGGEETCFPFDLDNSHPSSSSSNL